MPSAPPARRPGGGITRAYGVAAENYIERGNNRHVNEDVCAVTMRLRFLPRLESDRLNGKLECRRG